MDTLANLTNYQIIPEYYPKQINNLLFCTNNKVDPNEKINVLKFKNHNNKSSVNFGSEINKSLLNIYGNINFPDIKECMYMIGIGDELNSIKDIPYNNFNGIVLDKKKISFYMNKDSVSNELVQINNNGYVGIGNTNPKFKLDIKYDYLTQDNNKYFNNITEDEFKNTLNIQNNKQSTVSYKTPISISANPDNNHTTEIIFPISPVTSA